MTVFEIGRIVAGVIAVFGVAALIVYFKVARYDDAVERIVEAAVSRQFEKEAQGFAKMPPKHQLIAIEQRAVRMLLQRRMKLPPDLSERIRARLNS